MNLQKNRILKIGGKEFNWGERTYVMGVVNMTPDSFSGDGLSYDVDAAVEQALTMQKMGADIIDVGGESTRPPGSVYGEGGIPVSTEEELIRVLPLIRSLKDCLSIPISIDTYKLEVAKEALKEGASIINDVWGLKRDPELARLAASAGACIVLTHNQDNNEYYDLMSQVVDEIRNATEVAIGSGVPRENIIVDPGIGFGKRVEHNLEILRRLEEFKAQSGFPTLVSTSRKSFIGVVLGGLPPSERVEGTAATVAIAISNGVDIVRVHDVKQLLRVCRLSDAIARGWKVHSDIL